jgi:hypothetical protein
MTIHCESNEGDAGPIFIEEDVGVRAICKGTEVLDSQECFITFAPNVFSLKFDIFRCHPHPQPPSSPRQLLHEGRK